LKIAAGLEYQNGGTRKEEEVAMAQRHSSLHSFALGAMVLIALGAAHTALAQTSVFAYQGKLDFDGVPANGQFDFQFKLFDAASGGSQQGATLEQLTVNVTNGDYKVNLDFGASVFTGAERFIEVSYRFSGSTTYTTLPRQQVTSTPYAIRSLVATSADALSGTCSSCVTSGQIQSVQGGQVTGNIAGSQISGTVPVASVPAGSANYIQNTTSQQVASNFNISGNGTAAGTLAANVVNATTQYNLGGLRVLSNAGSNNLFVGTNAGNNNTGSGNAFFGADAGQSTTTGYNNAFFGAAAGKSNTTAIENAFFGEGAGQNNTSGSANSFFGHDAGQFNTTGGVNAFFGQAAGWKNTTGGSNSFFGVCAGCHNTTGDRNSFFGWLSGDSTTSGGFNSFFGSGAGSLNTKGMRNTFIGQNADFDTQDPTGDNNTALGYTATIKSGVSSATVIGTGAKATASHTVVLGTDQEVVIVPGKLEVGTLAVAGNQHVCLNNNNRLAPCSSSLRYKTDLRPFAAGMAIINRLQPISFTWRDGGMRDLGFGAEDVRKIEPLLVTTNAQGLVEGVKYDRIAVVLVNAIKELQQQLAVQQAHIEQQRGQIEKLQRRIRLKYQMAASRK
jgi:hypothetical protein